MKIGKPALLVLAIAAEHTVSSFSTNSKSVVASTTNARSTSRLYSSVVEARLDERGDGAIFARGQVVDTGPPAETEEVYGTIVGDTKGAALMLEDVVISRGATPLLKNINWSVQANDRWGIVGINGAGKSVSPLCDVAPFRLITSNIRISYN